MTLIWLWIGLCSMSHAQQTDPVQAGADALRSENFPWYNSESNMAQITESSNTQSAASAQRGSVTVRAERQTTATQNNWSGWIKEL